MTPHVHTGHSGGKEQDVLTVTREYGIGASELGLVLRPFPGIFKRVFPKWSADGATTHTASRRGHSLADRGCFKVLGEGVIFQ